MASGTVVLVAPSNQKHRWTPHRAAVIRQWLFWSHKQRRIFGSMSLNGEVGHAESRIPSIVIFNYA
jgi:hypothetical protein